MKKVCVILFAFWIAACTAIPFPDSPLVNPSATLKITQASPTEAFPSMTPTIVSTNASTSIQTPTQIPVFPPTLIIPTLQTGSSVKLSGLSYIRTAPWLQMIDAQIGWAIQRESSEILRPGGGYPSPFEGYILRTTDGGKTWQNVTPPTGAYSPGGFFALDANHAWASENVPCCTEITATRIWRTTDGGMTWQPSQPFSIIGPYISEFYSPTRMQFVDQNTGWLLASFESGMGDSLYDTLFHTTDGGDTWEEINGILGDLESGCGGGLAFINTTTGWYGSTCFSGKKSVLFNTYFGEGGLKVKHTTDGGNSFFLETLIPTPPDLQQPKSTNPEMECVESRIITFAPDVIGIEWGCIIYEIKPMQYRYFSLSTDAGQTWNTWESTGNEYFFNATHGWRLLSTGQLQQTTDSGLNWVTIKTVTWEGIQFDFISEQEGWAIVSSGDVTVFVHTTDGGKTWEDIKPVIASQ